MAKILFDIVISLGALIVLSPLLILIAILIKTTSNGPVLFKQKRYGLKQKVFTIYKFRSMTVDDSNGDFSQCVKGDVRVTFVGRFLRKLSMDELVQLFNVLLGDMSIVGPRPHAVEMDNEFLKIIPNYAKRFEAKPGITGLAQIRGFRGPTDTHAKIIGRIEVDSEYITKKTIFIDAIIIALTLPALIKPQNAF